MSQKNQPDSFAIIDKLVSTLRDQDLSSISYKTEDISIKMEKRVNVSQIPISQPMFPQVTPTNASLVSDSSTASTAPPDKDENKIIRSGIVGVVYLSHSPGAEPFIKAGDKIEKDSVVLIIEAMKVMNQITAPCDGEVERILVGDGEPVEYDQPLIYLV